MNELSNDQLRIIDANMNRLGEGLRVLEEYARMMLNDTVLTQKLKDIRHKTIKIDAELYKKLIQSRDAAEDIGSNMDVTGRSSGHNAQGVITANAKRAQESLRVLEEIAKIPELNLDSEVYREARFEIYTIEKELVARLLRREKIKCIRGVYIIIDTEWLKGRKPADIAVEAIKGGARILQLRCKDCGKKEFLNIARVLKGICEEKSVIFIINDSLEVALAVKADGIHIGQEDMPPADVKKLLPVDMIMGCSVRTVEKAKKAFKDGADYLGIGAMFPTTTKGSAEVVGVKRIEQVKKAVALPVVAIGGINSKNLSEVTKAGADAAAVISAVLGRVDVEKATRELVKIFRGKKGG